jgi:hypothetical protein
MWARVAPLGALGADNFMKRHRIDRAETLDVDK